MFHFLLFLTLCACTTTPLIPAPEASLKDLTVTELLDRLNKIGSTKSTRRLTLLIRSEKPKKATVLAYTTSTPSQTDMQIVSPLGTTLMTLTLTPESLLTKDPAPFPLLPPQTYPYLVTLLAGKFPTPKASDHPVIHEDNLCWNPGFCLSFQTMNKTLFPLQLRAIFESQFFVIEFKDPNPTSLEPRLWRISAGPVSGETLGEPSQLLSIRVQNSSD
jgi:hypothetical protein